MTTKSAPTLRQYVENGEGDPFCLEKRVKAELRALLAIANAVGQMKRRAYHGNWMAYAERAFNAHDRLSRLSAPRSPGNTRRGKR